jgi:hypothetical protein
MSWHFLGNSEASVGRTEEAHEMHNIAL